MVAVGGVISYAGDDAMGKHIMSLWCAINGGVVGAILGAVILASRPAANPTESGAIRQPTRHARQDSALGSLLRVVWGAVLFELLIRSGLVVPRLESEVGGIILLFAETFVLLWTFFGLVATTLKPINDRSGD